MKPLLSIIVPVYNTEKYLKRCIQSLLNQTLKNFEIILVDDGSEDNSSRICDEYTQKDRRIQVIHKKNEGLGFARNSGIELAKGTYFAFVDSDDYVDNNIYQLMYEKILMTKSDTCYCYFARKNNNDEIITDKLHNNYELFESKNGFNPLLLDMIGAPPNYSKDSIFDMSVCKALFSNKIINQYKIRFVSEREWICEDLIFEIDYLKHAKKVCIVKKPLYTYCENEGSLTHKYHSNRFIKEKELYNLINQKLEGLCNNELYYYRINKLFLGRCRICILNEIRYSNEPFNEKINIINAIINDPLVVEILRNYPYWKNPIKQRIFNYFIKMKNIKFIYLLAVLQIKQLKSII